MEKISVYGASGHAKVIIDILHSNGNAISYVFDDNPAIEQILDYEVVHQPTTDKVMQNFIIIGVGNNRIRKEIAVLIKGKYASFISHSSAIISPSAKIGKGTVVMANASVNAEAVVGEHCIINTGAVVEHEAILKDFVHISPNASIAGNVQIDEGTQIGLGASVIQNINIGKWATVGAGAVVINDVPNYATVVGNPGKIIKFNKIYEAK
ncbi:acetyltransferase [Zunongwangia sp. F260]|uniref:Acetyltransferase n=1 Tax=Autumnicola lenta TaxID=3075593 RepID=A0ABU3CMS8_9FLAO|nr:acetyltransferase [Zunongwangia sp. F260]MDT0647596.1 acetyltransferase [Zunongwangia sp. F260]